MASEVRTYAILLEPDPEGGFTVTVPVLPGCVTQGESVEDCLAHAREAVSVYIEDLLAAGDPVPTESQPPQLMTVAVVL